jgi:hypothetical protein
MDRPASGTCPLPLIEPELIEHMPTLPAHLARGERLVHFQYNPPGRIAFVKELPADFAERGVSDRASIPPACQAFHVQVFNCNDIEFPHQAGGESMNGRVPLLPDCRVDPRHTQPLLLPPLAALLPSRKTPLLLP